MKAKLVLLIGSVFMIAICACTCGCGNKPSKAAEMNRIADSTYRADSAKIYAK